MRLSFELDKIMAEAEELIFGGVGTQRLYVSTMVAIVAVTGISLGIMLPNHTAIPQPWATVSAVVGWLYFATWSISFYPQIIVNWQRKSVVGLSFDFVLLNQLGFLSYAIYTCTLFTNADIKQEYRERHGGQGNGVRINDVIFALHAVAATFVVILQCAVYERGTQTLSKTCQAVTAAILLGCGAVLWATQSDAFPEVEDLDLIYIIGYIKVGITFMKYLPQVVLNFRRKSTDGFAIGPVLCDITGSVLSIGQQALDSVALEDWTVMTGNSVKLGIGLVGMVYDTILIVQHYILYPEAIRPTLLPLHGGGGSIGDRNKGDGSLDPELHRALVANGVH